MGKEVKILRDGLEELQKKTVSSPRMDGMPKGGGAGDAMAGLLIQKQRQQEKLARAERQLKRRQSAARRVIAPFPAPMRMFFAAYFIDLMKAEDACRYAGVSIRTGSRYIALVKQDETA